jgi:hypothetical protein
MRDWQSGIVTVTVRDQRYRQHDPILGVVPLRLSEILDTSSQVTRWYPLDGGIGFGRIRISLLFRSVETRLPPNMLGWDVGTFEFMSDRILALNYHSNAKLKLRTGGSTGAIRRHDCQKLEEGDGMFWDLTKKEGKHSVRLPVKHRYRSPVVFEFHTAGKRGAAAYAIIWLHHLVDNEPVDIDIPIWTTKLGNRLTQNYVTEVNVAAKQVPGLEDLTEIGRLQFRARFKAGTDESHKHFVVDNDTRETFETWEACLAEGVRDRQVTPEVPDTIQDLHDASLTEGRDLLKQEDPEERQKWISKTGEDWSGAFGHDPKAYTDRRGRKIAEPGRDPPPHDPTNPSSDEDHDNVDNFDSDSDDSDSLGIQDATHADGRNSMNGDPRPSTDTHTTRDTNYTARSRSSNLSQKDRNKANKKSEERKQRGLMQWKPARNAVFAKDEAKFGLKKLKSKLTGGLEGRQPGIETEAGA